MSVSNGESANATTFNDGFVSKTANSTTIGQITLNNADSSSGSQVTNIQRELNAFSSYTGKATNVAEDTVPVWTSSDIGASTDSLFDRIEAIHGEFPINLTTQVTSTLPIANGGTGRSAFESEQVLFGAVEQASSFTWNDIGLALGQSAASSMLDIDGTMAIRKQDVSVTAAYLQGIESSFLKITDIASSVSAITRVENTGLNNFLFIANSSSADITFTALDLAFTDDELLEDFTLSAKTMSCIAHDEAASGWYPLAGGGGASTAPTTNLIDGASLTGTTDANQVWVNTLSGGTVTLTDFDLTAVPNNGEVTFNCVNATGTLEITTAASGFGYMAGDFVGTIGDTITFTKATVIGELIEKHRSINQP